MRVWLKTEREQSHLTQAEIAKLLGITQQYYCMIENGNRQKNINLNTMFKLSKVFNVPVEKLIEEENNVMESDFNDEKH